MTNVETKEKTLRVLIINMYNKNSRHVELPMTDVELNSFMESFNPEGNCCEMDGIDVLTSINTHLTSEHKNSIANSGLDNCTIETINKAARILQEDANFAFILHACDSFNHALEVYTDETYTIFREVPDEETFGEEFAKHTNLFDGISNPIIKEHFDFASFCTSLYNNEVMKDVANDIVVHLHKTH